ncbi:protein mono-ADP-ribosyltransferase PARP4 isoform 3-T4 [Anomaloglossus baeobatrachus]|uniref:protein mono-ADP-ribosyltransferase PARP4 isoform X3 n=1 Tax=Anomaloglossus baeobatrachus TaxID=238106 RepID=UPI003F4F4C11
MGVGLFSDCIFFLKVNSLSLKEKKKLKNSITSNGGELSFVLNDKCTHAVVSNTAALNSSQQKKIEKHLISVVNPDFIWKSVQGEPLGVQGEGLDDNKSCDITGDGDHEAKKNLFQERRQKLNSKETLESNLEEDMEFEESGLDNIPDDTEVAKYCCFKKDEEYAIVELLCFSKKGSFPFRISTVCGIPNTSQSEFTFHMVETAEKACEKYQHRINDLKNKGFRQINKVPLQAENFASKALKKVLLGEAINVTELSPEVAGLVESMWVDAVGHLDSILSCPVENISLNDLSKAEGILRQIRNALVNKDRKEDISQMMQEFYQCIPHKERRQNNINMKFLTVKQDLCQVIRDMINVCETSLSRYTPTSTAKYQALRCRIEHVDPHSEEFIQMKQNILDHNHSNREFNILRLFRVGRMSEATNFKSDVGNVQSLLHASSPCNFVGILSRGLMMPKIIVEEFGGERTDIGNLGSGIYFSDSISTSVKYSPPSDITGSHLLVICDVALGKCTDVFHRNYTITEAPNGFDSVHGVKCKEGVKSDFTDDEYVVYDVNQVQMRYVVQFSTDGDYVDLNKESLFISIDQASDHCMSLPEQSEDVSVDDLPDQQVTKGGLKGSDGQQIPLESIHVKAQLKDLAAQVVIFQTYKNNSTVPIEAKYVFPLDGTAAVCGFEAFINGKHIIGEVKEKQKAHQEYRTAISEGHGAYLMDQDAPDVFTVSVGNLPSKATVVIKITYVMELSFKYSCIDFTIPGNVAEWQQDKALKENTQDTVEKVGIGSDMAPGGSFCLDMSIEMPRKIESISSYTHEIKIKRTECKAVIQTKEASSFNDQGFMMVIYMESYYIPRMWVEKHPDQDSEACMLIFQPEIESFSEDVFLTICLDCSNSMESCFQSAKQVALLAVDSIYTKYTNIVLFGSSSEELYIFPKSHHGDDSDMKTFIKKAKPTMGSTEFWKVLQCLQLLTPKMGRHKVLLISDGHVQNENLIFQILSKHKNDIQLFTCGVGTTANKHMLRCFAQYGSGAFEYFADKSKGKWKDQMQKQSDRLSSPACTAVSVKWRQFNENPELLQAPANIQALFSNDSVFVYGFVPYCTQATLKALINNEEIENMVSTTELQKTTGTMLHTLTARALVKDYEDGILFEKENENEMKKQEMKSSIIALSMEYSIVTQFTSFVAVEKRSAEEDMDIEPNVLEIISAEDVDILPYMDWSDKADVEERAISSKGSSSCSTDNGSRSASPVSTKSPYGSCQIEEEEVEDEDMGFGLFDESCEDDEHPQGRIKFLMSREEDEDGESYIITDELAYPEKLASPVLLQRATSKKKRRMRIPELFDDLSSLEMSIPQSAPTGSLFGTASGGGGFGLQQETSAQLPSAFIFANSALCTDQMFSRKLKKVKELSKLEMSIPQSAPIGTLFGAASGGDFGLQQETSAQLPSPFTVLSSAPSTDQTISGPPEMSMDALVHGARPLLSAKPISARLLKFKPAADFSAPSMAPSYQSIKSAVDFSAPSMAPSYMPTSPEAQLIRTRRQVLSEYSKPVPTSAPRMSQSLEGAEPISTVLDSETYVPMSPSFKPQARVPLMAPGALGKSMFGFGLFGKSSNMEALEQKESPPSLPGSSHADVLQPVNYSADRIRSAKFHYKPVPKAVPFAAPPPPPPMVSALQRRQMNILPPPPPPGGRGSPSAICSTADMSRSQSFQLSPAPYQKPRFLRGRESPSAICSTAQYSEMSRLASFQISPAPYLLSGFLKIKPPPPSWPSLSSLQSQEGFWLLNQELGTLLNINVGYFTADFLVKKGITSLGARGIDAIHKLIATLLVLQIIRAHNILSDIKFKTLMKLDPSIPISSLYPSIEKAIEWAVKSDRQFPGICMRLGLGKDWDQATRQLLGLDPISTTSDLYLVSESLFLS